MNSCKIRHLLQNWRCFGRTLSQGCQLVFTKKARPFAKKSQNKPDSSFKTYAHKTCIRKHKTDIKTQQKHRYNTFPILEEFCFPVIVVCLFLIEYIEHFWSNSKIFAIFFVPCMHIDTRQNRFVVDMQLRDCFARAKPFRPKKSQKKSDFVWFFLIYKKAKSVEKARISKSGFKKGKLATLLWPFAFYRPGVQIFRNFVSGRQKIFIS